MTSVDGPADESRARLGVVLPSVNTVVEPWFARAVPSGVTVHASRMLLAPELSAAAIVEMDRKQARMALQQIASCKPASVAYCCTASSIVQGLAYDQQLRQEIERETGAKATTAAHSLLCALGELQVRRISVVSPYSDEVDAAEHRFFEAAGFRILGAANLGIRDSFGLAEPDADTLVALARRGWSPDAEALVITCLNTRSHIVAERLEHEIGKPVVTSTTATLWHALRLAGVADSIKGYGRLLAQY